MNYKWIGGVVLFCLFVLGASRAGAVSISLISEVRSTTWLHLEYNINVTTPGDAIYTSPLGTTISVDDLGTGIYDIVTTFHLTLPQFDLYDWSYTDAWQFIPANLFGLNNPPWQIGKEGASATFRYDRSGGYPVFTDADFSFGYRGSVYAPDDGQTLLLFASSITGLIVWGRRCRWRP